MRRTRARTSFRPKALHRLLLAWWFAATLSSSWGPTAITTIGPFRSQEECERVRGEVQRHRASIYRVSTFGCWWDGRSP